MNPPDAKEKERVDLTRWNGTVTGIKETSVDNDKIFATYALSLIAGTITLVTAIFMGSGHSFPPFAFVAEHLALSLLFRSAYHSLDGSNWIVSALELSGMIGTQTSAQPDDAAASAA
jgi:hypothetical protein